MKLILSLLSILVISSVMGDDRVKVDFYSEALWPGCQGVYAGSVAKAL